VTLPSYFTKSGRMLQPVTVLLGAQLTENSPLPDTSGISKLCQTIKKNN